MRRLVLPAGISSTSIRVGRPNNLSVNSLALHVVLAHVTVEDFVSTGVRAERRSESSLSFELRFSHVTRETIVGGAGGLFLTPVGYSHLTL